MSQMATPITITLYDPVTDEVKQTYTRLFVPWKLLKQAIRLSKSLDANNMTDESIDALAGLVAEVFGNKFSVEELNEGADVNEMLTVLQTVIARAGGAITTSPPPNSPMG